MPHITIHMNNHVMKIVIACLLAVCFLIVSTTVAGSMAHHAQQHAHDQDTHTQTWCGWMCAAGQAIDAPSIPFAQHFTLIGLLVIALTSALPSCLALSPGSRDPPFSTM